MKLNFWTLLQTKGYSFMEILLLGCTLLALLAFGMVSLGNLDEEKDAQVVQSVQTKLQTFVSQGSARLDIRPSDFGQPQLQAILLAVQANLAQTSAQAQDGLLLELSPPRSFTLTVKPSGRKAVFTVDQSGRVNLSRVENFATYRAKNDVIQKSP